MTKINGKGKTDCSSNNFYTPEHNDSGNTKKDHINNNNIVFIIITIVPLINATKSNYYNNKIGRESYTSRLL